jgi:methylase of polypeptide subunit release factors
MQEHTIAWSEDDTPMAAIWRSERGDAPPKRVQLADDTLSADSAYKLASEGVGLLWRGDFHNAKHLIAALERRLDKRQNKRAPGRPSKPDTAQNKQSTPADLAAAFYRHRQAQAQRARVLSMVLLPFQADYGIHLRRAPDVRLACSEAWGNASKAESGAGKISEAVHSVASLRELLGIISAHEWRKKGVEISALNRNKKGVPERIHAHYGVFSPVRQEYVELVREAPLPTRPSADKLLAFDIGIGTGVLSCVLAQRGVGQIVGTDLDARALTCAKENAQRLVGGRQVKLIEADLFPDVVTHGLAHLIVCNPPWLPGTPSSSLERAVYDPSSQMLRGFLQGLSAHLAPGGEAWLILSDLAEHLGLRKPDELQQMIANAGLHVLGSLRTQPRHPKAQDTSDPLHAARAAETTVLWRLTVAKPTV